MRKGQTRFGTAYVPGGFDMFHIGHLNILRSARGIADWVVAGVVTDGAIMQVKGRHPVIPFAERAAIVGSICFVDEVVEIDSSSKLDAWRLLGFDVVVKGDDWQGTAKGAALEADMASVGVAVRYFPYTCSISSTMLRGAVPTEEGVA